MVTHKGIPSGMAATASVTAIRIMYNQAGLPGLEGSVRLKNTDGEDDNANCNGYQANP